MRFKAGDKVRVREWDDMEKEFGLDEWGDIETFPHFDGEMKEFCGKTFVVECIDRNGLYKMLGNAYHWGDDMLIPADFKRSDLEDMMICEQRDGSRFFWIDGTLKGFDLYCSGTTEDLKNESGCKEFDIVKVYKRSTENTLEYMLRNPGPLLWERKEEKEISSDEAFRVLREYYGCDVKIKE